MTALAGVKQISPNLQSQTHGLGDHPNDLPPLIPEACLRQNTVRAQKPSAFVNERPAIGLTRPKAAILLPTTSGQMNR